MIITVVGYKGGVGKTTTAIHLAAYFQEKGSTLLVDGDPNHSASRWVERSSDFPVTVKRAEAANGQLSAFQHVVIDTQARPSPEDLQDLARSCDLLVLPCSPDALALDALMLTVQALAPLQPTYRILLTLIPPWPSRDGAEARTFLEDAKLPLFKQGIRRMVAYQKAALEGVPVYQANDPRAKVAWNDYVAVGKEILP